jgi:hypothetical protein
VRRVMASEWRGCKGNAGHMSGSWTVKWWISVPLAQGFAFIGYEETQGPLFETRGAVLVWIGIGLSSLSSRLPMPARRAAKCSIPTIYGIMLPCLIVPFPASCSLWSMPSSRERNIVISRRTRTQAGKFAERGSLLHMGCDMESQRLWQ